MPLWKKVFNKSTGTYYPHAVVNGDPIDSKTLAQDLAHSSTVSNADVQAVLADIARAMHIRMSQGQSVHLNGLGHFRYSLDTKGVKDLADFNFEKQVKAVRVEFTPERSKTTSGSITRALVDSDKLRWVEVPGDFTDTFFGDGDEDEDPLDGGGDGGGGETPDPDPLG